MGKAPNVKNFFVAAGFNSMGILSGGGAGYIMGRWVLDGHPPMDIWDVDLRRTQPFQNNHTYLRDRTGESLGIAYQMHWPNRQWETARGVKRSPLHAELAEAGACFGESAGWERPNWFAKPGQPATYDYDFGQQNWFENNAAEHRAVREAVGIFDQSSFSKFLIQGRDAVTALNRMATANMDGPTGKVVYTQLLNERGGIEADITISRLSETEFLLVTAAFTHTHVLAWLREHTPADAHCFVTDVSSAYAMLNVQGPNSRALLSRISNADFDNENFPFGSVREIEIGYQRALALRISYAGELGWELYVPTEMAHGVYGQLTANADEFGLAHCGYHTLNTLRIERAFREWAHDLCAYDSLLEAGLAFTCDWEKPGGFIGREKLLKDRDAGLPKRKLAQFLLDDPEPILQHNEPIFRNGERVGFTTSAGYGHTLGGCVALGYVEDEDGVSREFIETGYYQIEQANRLHDARASLEPMYNSKTDRS